MIATRELNVLFLYLFLLHCRISMLVKKYVLTFKYAQYYLREKNFLVTNLISNKSQWWFSVF